MFDIADTVDGWLEAGQPVALATVVETWGSSPRQAGAKMAVRGDMAMIGSVSGGCVETAVVQEALDGLADGKARLLHYGVSDDTAWEVGLACGGKMSVYVEPLDRALWEATRAAMRAGHPLGIVTAIDGPLAGRKLFVTGENVTGTLLGDARCGELAAAGREAVTQRAPSRKQIAGLDVLIDVVTPQPRVVIVGGAHVAMALHQFAAALGFAVIVIDPREVFATPERFPKAQAIYTLYPHEVFAQVGLDSETYIAILTHDPKIDDPALRAALPANVPYVGILSSKRAHQQRIERLKAGGMDERLLERVRTPIGLDINARTPEEIALCIMAEIVAVRNGAG
jgi:xanthine dehydrogenase accessory factor